MRDATSVFEPFVGQLVGLQVRPDTYEIDAQVLPKEAMAYWRTRRPILGNVPCPDRSYVRLDGLEEMAAASGLEDQLAERFGSRIAFLVGFDVQHILQEGTPEQVRAEVKYLIDTFDRPEGGMCLAAGNGIVAGTPLGNIEAYLEEAVRYGEEHRSSF